MARNKRSQGAIALTAITIVSAAAGGCSPRPASLAEVGILKEWEKELNLAKPSTQARKLADATQPKCLRDRINASGIAAEIERLERMTPSNGVGGKALGVDRTQLTPAQSRFLSDKNLNWIYATGPDFSDCKSAACVINKLYYGRPSGDAGLKLYGWYLKTGYMLSVNDRIPIWGSGNNGAQFAEVPATPSYRSYFFTDEELTAFWKLSFVLSDEFKYLSTLQTFHRIPTGTDPMKWEDRACGDASGSVKRGGFVRLNENCLKTGGKLSGTSGYFYTAVTHEIAHEMDLAYGTEGRRYSEDPEWSSISGWHRVEVTDPANGSLKGVQWVVDPTKEKCFRDYSGKNPVEDWADSVAYVRLEPEEAARKIPNKTALISAKVYGGRTFDSAGLGKHYLESALGEVRSGIAQLVQGCILPVSSQEQQHEHAKGSGESSDHFSLTASLPKAAAACISAAFDERLTAALDRLRGNEFEACDHLAGSEAGIRAQVIQAVSDEVRAAATQQAELLPVLAAMRGLQDALAAELDPREAYLHCHRQPDAHECFSQSVAAKFDELAQPFTQTMGARLPQERQRFLAENDYENARVRVIAYFQQIFMGIDRALLKGADATWKACSESFAALPAISPESGLPAVPAEGIPTQPFSGGAQFIAGEFLTCLNTRILDDLGRVRDQFASRLGISVTDPDAAALVRDMLLPAFLEALDRKVPAEVISEGAERDRRKAEVIDLIVQTLDQELSWVQGPTAEDGIMNRCRPLAESRFPDAFRGVSATRKIPVKYVAVEELQRSWSSEACARAMSSPGASAALEEATKQWNSSMGEMRSFVLTRADAVSKQCRAKFRGNDLKTQRARRTCLLDAWSGIEAGALGEWGRTVLGIRYGWRKPDAEQHLVSQRKNLQETAIRKLERP